MTVKVSKPAINVREELADLRKPTGVAGEAMLRAETPQEQFNLIGAGRRNLVINGGMQVSQRGNATGITTNTFGGPDRWKVWTNIGAISLNQSTDAPDGFSNSLEIDITTAGTVASSTYFQTAYKIEAQDVQHLSYGSSTAKDITLSFWVKSNKAGTYQVNFRLDDTSKMASKAYTINAADTWEYKTLTVAGSTADIIPNDNGNGLMLDFWLASGSNYDSGVTSDTYITLSGVNYNAASTVDLGTSTSDYWRITGVQLELGKVATPFEHRSYGEELALCQRYYYKGGVIGGRAGISAGYTSSSTSVRWTFVTPSNMRATPTYSAGSNPYAADNGTNREVSSVSVLGATQNTISMIGTIAGSGSHRSLTISYGGSQNFKLDAEL